MEVQQAMEDICRPYIIYLTDIQEQAIWQHIKQNSWKISVFTCIQHDWQFLVDLMIQGEELDIAFIKDSVLHNIRRHGKRRQFERKISRLESKNDYSDHSSSEQDVEQLEKLDAPKVENIHGKNVQNEPQKENSKKKTSKESLKKENRQEELREINAQESLLEEDLEERLKEVKHCNNLTDKDENAKGRKRLSSHNFPQRRRKYRNKKHANIVERISHFSCEVCGKVAASERYLQRHIEKLHSEEAQKRKVEEKRRKQDQEINVCHICRKQFAHKYALTAHHLNIHSGKKEVFQCDLCGAIVKHKGSLVQHKKSVHSDQRPHKCDVCGSEFKLYQQLKTHRRRHDPDFVETCTICGKTLKKGHLSTHMKRHTNDRKFRCDKCSKTFYEKQDLERHMILHSGEKPNKCPHCSYACAFKGNLSKHIKVRHETDLYLPELQENKICARSKCNSKVKVNRIQSSKELTSEHHLNIETHIYSPTQTHLSRERTDQLSSVQYSSRDIADNGSGNKPRLEDMNYQNDLDEGFKRPCVPSVQVFSDTDSQSESFTSDCQLHILRPVQHDIVSDQLVHNLPDIDHEVGSANFIDFKETYLLKMPSNEVD